MREFARKLTGIVTAAVLGAVVLAGTANAQKKRDYVDQLEFDPYNEVIKDINAKNFAKMIKDLDAWKAKYPASQYSDLWQLYYVQAYAGAGECGKAVGLAGELMNKDLDKLYPDPAESGNVITILYTTLQCLSDKSSPSELETIRKAAEMLGGYNRQPKGMTDAVWADLKKQLKPAVDQALLSVAVMPGGLAMAQKPPDCDKAAKVFSEALVKYPNNTLISYNLGGAWLCLGRANNQEKMGDWGPKAIYEYARTVAIDPTAGASQTAATTTGFLTRIYTSFHGSDEGLEDLKTKSKGSPLPPDGFTIKTGSQIALEKEKEFSEKYPQLSIWLRIKATLAGPEGPSYFAGTLKDADLPELKGTVVEGKPACRSKELLISFPEPGQQGTVPTVVSLKLEKPLTGKPEAGTEITFKGVPTAFTPEPFLLTLDTENANIKDLKTSPCAVAPPKAAPKKGVTTKKK